MLSCRFVVWCNLCTGHWQFLLPTTLPTVHWEVSRKVQLPTDTVDTVWELLKSAPVWYVSSIDPFPHDVIGGQK